MRRGNFTPFQTIAIILMIGAVSVVLSEVTSGSSGLDMTETRTMETPDAMARP